MLSTDAGSTVDMIAVTITMTTHIEDVFNRSSPSDHGTKEGSRLREKNAVDPRKSWAIGMSILMHIVSRQCGEEDVVVENQNGMHSKT